MMKFYLRNGYFIIYNEVTKTGFTNFDSNIPIDHRIVVNFPCEIIEGKNVKLGKAIKTSKFSEISVKLDRNFSKTLKLFGFCDNSTFVLAALINDTSKLYYNSERIIVPSGYAKHILPLRHIPVISISGGNRFLRVEVIPPP
ncbi:MAG: hypothetical protein QXD03_01785 [Candidatus Anstonellales archaeon]